MLQIKNLQAGYGKIKVLKKISLHVNAGEIVTLIGANGAGKTTLLYTIAGMIKKTGGEIVLFGSDTRKQSAQAIVKSGCSLVPEGRQVFATMTVENNLYLGGYVKYKKEKSYDRTLELKTIYDIFPVLEDQLAGTLSGGEQQMLAMGRSLMARPKLIMMDEPSTGLAPLIVKNIFQIIIKLREAGNTVLLIEQNAKAALGIADRGYVMETGKIIIQGPAEDLLANNDVQRAYLGRDVDDANASCEI